MQLTYTSNLPTNFKNQLTSHDQYDVIVVGGGPAGIAAAVTAAEQGLHTLIIERLGFFGGAAVSGMSGTICGLFMTVDEPSEQEPQQLVFGFAERFRQQLYQNGGLTEPQIYGKTWVATHDCATYKRVATDLLRDAGVNVLLHTQVVDVISEEDATKGLVLATDSGFTSVYGKKFIDCSGNAEIAFRSGLATFKGDQGAIQNPTMIFKVANVDMERYLDYWGQDTISPPKVVDMLMAEDELLRKKVWLFPTVNKGEVLVNATKITGFDGRALDVTDPLDHTEAEQFSIYQAQAFFQFMKTHVPGCEEAYFVDYANEVGVRQTRSIEGLYKLTNDDVVNKRKRADGIVKSSWPIELHYGAKPKTEWLFNDYYEVPFHTLVPKIGANVIVAGRCLSSEHEALASSRVTAQCFEYGRAAALAANMAIKQNCDFRDLDSLAVVAAMRADEE